MSDQGKTSEAAEPPVVEADQPWYKIESQRVVRLYAPYKYSADGWMKVYGLDSDEARELAAALHDAAEELDGPA